MPSIIEYDIVLARMLDLGLRCQYYNSGAFGFDADVPMHFSGWIGADDPSIRPAALARARKIAAPFEATLAQLVTRVWKELLPGGPVWIMPKSSWAYELDFGSKAWLPAALRLAGLDPALLEGRTNAPAIEMMPEESDRFTALVWTLLENLHGSDFALAFPGQPVTCTVHHHKQIWWTSSDRALVERIEAIAE